MEDDAAARCRTMSWLGASPSTSLVSKPRNCVISVAMDRVVIAHGDSVPANVLVTAPGPIARGDYVSLWIQHPILGPRPVHLTKQVVCLANDQLHFKDNAYRCNERLLGSPLAQTWDHRPLNRMKFEGRIPAGYAFVMGTHPRSFDSRYFGLVRIARLQRLQAVC